VTLGRAAGFAAVCGAAALLSLALARPPARAQSSGSGYTFSGGTAAQRATVRAALAASGFDWSLVPTRVTIHILPRGGCAAARGEIWLDSRTLAAGREAWGIVQHEYAHEVDFFLLDSARRARLGRLLGAKTWWSNGRLRHDQYGAERFASTLAYAYWPSRDNVLIRDARAEATAMRPAAFRRALRRMIDPAGAGG